jgi:hypothetical protein
MPISEDAKDLLRERLKLARQAKLDKKNKVAEALNKTAPTENVKPPSAENEVKEATPTVVNKPSVAIDQPIDSVAILPKASKVAKSPKASPKKKSPKVAKTKYAKLVFYQEPTQKKMKKLTKIMDESSESEDEDFHYKAPPVQETTSRQLQYNKISQLSRMIFD